MYGSPKRRSRGSGSWSAQLANPLLSKQANPRCILRMHGGGVISQGDIDALPRVERLPVRLVIFQPGVQIARIFVAHIRREEFDCHGDPRL
jgi:hypothetical protein